MYTPREPLEYLPYYRSERNVEGKTGEIEETKSKKERG